MNTSQRKRYQLGMQLEGPRSSNSTEVRFGHYPLLEHPPNPAWYAQPKATLQTRIPEYVALDDVMLYVVYKLFTPGQRRRFWGLDFDSNGNIRGARECVGAPPIVTYQGIRYYLVFRKHYVLKGNHSLGNQTNILSRWRAMKEGKNGNSDFSFGAVIQPPWVYATTTPIDMTRQSKTGHHSMTGSVSTVTPPPSGTDPIWLQEDLSTWRKDYFWDGKIGAPEPVTYATERTVQYHPMHLIDNDNQSQLADEPGEVDARAHSAEAILNGSTSQVQGASNNPLMTFNDMQGLANGKIEPEYVADDMVVTPYKRPWSAGSEAIKEKPAAGRMKMDHFEASCHVPTTPVSTGSLDDITSDTAMPSIELARWPNTARNFDTSSRRRSLPAMPHHKTLSRYFRIDTRLDLCTAQAAAAEARLRNRERRQARKTSMRHIAELTELSEGITRDIRRTIRDDPYRRALNHANEVRNMADTGLIRGSQLGRDLDAIINTSNKDVEEWTDSDPGETETG